jgi:hypothetical protein
MVAALLTIFIQQECGVTSCVTDTVAGTETCVTAHAPCSFSDNLSVSNGFGKLVVAFNFTTLGVFLVANAVFFFREKWIITHFDTDTDLPIDNLTDGACGTHACGEMATVWLCFQESLTRACVSFAALLHLWTRPAQR